MNETLSKVAATYHVQLSDALIGRHGVSDYLASRAIDEGIAERFELGYVADPLPGDEPYRGRLAIPYLTPAGVVAMKYRCIAEHDCKQQGPHHAKYAQPTGQAQHLYNVAAYHSGLDAIGVCEGEFDAIAATTHVGIPTMGLPGASQWKANGKYWSLALADFALVVIFADGDEPGRELAKDIAMSVPEKSRIVYCPDSEDVNSMVMNGRIEELKRKAGV